MSHQAQLICYSHTKSQFHASTYSQDIELSAILESVCSRASGAVTQELEFYQTQNLGRKAEYRNNTPFRLF